MSHEARRSRPRRPLPSVAPGPASRRCLALFAVGVAVSSAAVFVWLVTTFGARYRLVGPLDDFALLVLSGVVTAVSLAVAAVVAERRWRAASRGGALEQLRRGALWAVLGLGAIVCVPALWFAVVLSTVGHYTSLGVVGAHEYVVLETTFDQTGLSVFERHGLELVPVRVSGTTMTGGTPFRDGDFTVEHGTGTVVVTVAYGEFSFTPASERR